MLTRQFDVMFVGSDHLSTLASSDLLRDTTALITFFCLSLTSLLLLFSRNALSKAHTSTVTALLFVAGVLHFLLYWHRDQPVTIWAISAGTAAALLLTGVVASFIFSKRRRSRLDDTEHSLQAAQNQLSLEQHMMKSLVDNLPDSIYFKDTESRFIRCNRRTAEIFRLPNTDAAVGTSDYDYFSKEEADEYRADEVRIMQTGEPIINKEEYELWPDGEYHWVLSTKLPLRDADHNVIGTFGLSRDISNLKLAESDLAEKLKELEALHAKYMSEQQLFSSLIENIPDAVFFKDREHRFIRVNPAMAREAGFNSPDAMIGLTDADIWGSEFSAAARSDEQRIVERGVPLIGKEEEVIRKSDGARHWVLATKMPLRDGSGAIVGTFGLARNISTLKRMQQWLSDSQELFELAVQGTNEGLWDWRVETNEVWFAPRFRELLGITSLDNESLPKTLAGLTDRLHPDDRDRVMMSIDEHISTGSSHDEEFRLITSSEEYRWFRGRGQASWNDEGKPVRMVGSIQDIHDRHQAQADLASVKVQLQQALQGGNVGMWDWDILSNNVVVSPELMIQIGEDPNRPWTTLKDWDERLHPDDREAAKQKTWNYIEGRTDDYESSFRMKHADGGFRWILSRGKLFRDDDGRPGRFIGVHIDVTELHEARAALVESEARFRGIFNQTFQFIGLLTPDGEVVDANRASLDGAGLSPDEIIGKKFWDTIWWSHSQDLQQRLKQAVESAAAGQFDRFEATHPSSDGTITYVDFSLKPVTNDLGEVVYLIPEGRDVTELKKYQQDLKSRSDELERSNRELEQFAYVASHDLQEPLRTVVGFCQLLELEYRDRLDADGEMYLKTIVEGGKRMQSLISDLLEYSRVARHGKSFRTVDLAEIMEQVQAMLYSQIEESGATIQVRELPRIFADESQMIRLFQNLMGNAVKYRRAGSPNIRIWSVEESSGWKVYVSDDGIGIREEFSEQIFVIFRRLHTREEYPGTGIGLAICRRIVERHGGQIRLVHDHSGRVSPDHGSTFEIFFPKGPSRVAGDGPV